MAVRWLASAAILGATGMMAGCALTAERFDVDRAEASCEVLVGCFGLFDDVAVCADATSETTRCATFDAVAAADCVDGLWAVADACPADLLDYAPPAACDAVCP